MLRIAGRPPFCFLAVAPYLILVQRTNIDAERHRGREAFFSATLTEGRFNKTFHLLMDYVGFARFRYVNVSMDL
jgi:hypothetical protein